jgi:hypothetical protein
MTEPTYAEQWADAINRTYDDWDGIQSCLIDCQQRGEDGEATMRRVLKKVADCLRGGETREFSGSELDLIRHVIPAHEVHQSMARAVVGEYVAMWT